jgi:hypothetical protein
MPRHLDERLMLRFPRVTEWLAARLLALPPGSPLRRRILKRLFSRAWEAQARGDNELSLLFIDPAVEINVFGTTALGLDDHYAGHEGWRRFGEEWRNEWEGAEARPEWLIDMGDRLACRVRIASRGRSSGAGVVATIGWDYHLRNGKATTVVAHWSWPELATELGLSEPARATDR